MTKQFWKQDLANLYVDRYSNNVLQNVNLKIEEGELVSVMGSWLANQRFCIP